MDKETAMIAYSSHLELSWRVRPGGAGWSERRFLDFVIDGTSLAESLHTGDLVGCLGWGAAATEAQTRQTLLLQKPSILETGRVPLYVCPECGDIGCGAITARIEGTDRHFIWRDFGYENDYDPETPALTAHLSVGPFLFSKDDYRRALKP